MSGQRKYWITFRLFVENKIVEGDLVAETEKLDKKFFKTVKDGITSTAIRNNGGVLIKGMTEPTIQACILLDE